MRTVFAEFRDEVRATRYPFADTTTLRSRTNFVLDNGIILDASLYPLGGVPPLALSAVVIAGNTLQIQISDSRGTVVASGAVTATAEPEVISLADTNTRPAGVLVVDPQRIREVLAWGKGIHTFAAGTATFVAGCVIPLPDAGVRGLVVGDTMLTGDVWLVGDNGVVLREDATGAIRVDIVGDPLSRRALCEPLSIFETPNFIRSINDCVPDRFNNYNLTVGNTTSAATALRILPKNGGLHIELVGDPLGGTT